MRYIGRFAPSPTGLLHIGSLLTAVGSYLDAKANQGLWLLRIEDLDPPREVKGATAHILRTLEAFGLEWDGPVLYQSQRYAIYQSALEKLIHLNKCYPCYCSRKSWQSRAKIGIDGFVYDGYCSQHQSGLQVASLPAWRFYAPDEYIDFKDGILGLYGHHIKHDVGDFVLKRADGFWAYQLAVVVDDAEQNITHVVRGRDLLVSTPRQIALQKALGFTTPQYAHLPLLLNTQGQKWSKQTLAPEIKTNHPDKLLRQVFTYLNLPDAPKDCDYQDLLSWAIKYWDINRIPYENIQTKANLV